MFPKAEKGSYRALLSILLSRFLINTLPTPDCLKDGSLCDHIFLIGRPLIVSKFIVSRALSAEKAIYLNKYVYVKGFTTSNDKFMLVYSSDMQLIVEPRFLLND